MRSFFAALIIASAWATSVPTAQYDNSRDGANNSETILTPASLTSFHRLGSYSVDSPVWNQPLIAQNVNGRDLLVACTIESSCYAFDADAPGSAPVWSSQHFTTTRTSYTPDHQVNYQEPIGCLPTPVIDLANGFLYAACGNSTPAWELFQFNLATGGIVNHVTISGSVPGTGDAGDAVINGQLQFNPTWQLSRPGLTLANGNVYVCFGSYGDDHPWHGWIFAYNASTLALVSVFNTTPNSYGGAIWNSGGGLAVDQAGNLYTPTGNGHYDGVTAFGNSVLKLSPTLQLLGSYTPGNFSTLEAMDWDLTSGRPALVPGTSLLVFGAKDFNFYSLDTTCMCSPQVTQVIPPFGTGSQDVGVYAGSVMANGLVFFPTTTAGAFSYRLTTGTWSSVNHSTAFGYPGPTMTYSSNAGTNAILWVVTANADAIITPQPGTLRAWDPLTFTELWNSGTLTTDALGTMAKFATPTVANGRVYVSTLDNRVQVYGLPPQAGAGRISINPTGVSSTTRR